LIDICFKVHGKRAFAAKDRSSKTACFVSKHRRFDKQSARVAYTRTATPFETVVHTIFDGPAIKLAKPHFSQISICKKQK
jgi:hypothetical protein